MPYLKRSPAAFFLLSIALLARAASADATVAPSTRPAAPDNFIRFVDDGHGGGRLETADVEFRNDAGAAVHLVAAVHIGEKSYYQGLVKEFDGYDAVLYELVKSKEAAPPAPGDVRQSDSAISQFQHLLKDVLDLDFQLDDIDYTKANFVHADLDKETFERMQAERGESFESLMLQQLLKQLTQPHSSASALDEDPVALLLTVLTRPDAARQLKVVIARQMGNMDAEATAFDAPGGTVIVTERNKAALAALSTALAAGKKDVAIFYGAAHMPDMTKRLGEMGFKPVATGWNRAWDLTIRADQPSAIEKMLSDLFKPDDGGN